VTSRLLKASLTVSVKPEKEESRSTRAGMARTQGELCGQIPDSRGRKKKHKALKARGERIEDVKIEDH